MFLGAEGVWLLLVVIAAAIALVVVLGPRWRDDRRADVGTAEAILRERLAAGEIGETEYRERSAVLASHRPSRPIGVVWPAVVVVIVGVLVLGLIVGAATAWPGRGRWAPMSGPMNGMQDMNGMMGPRATTDGQAPATFPGATEIAIDAGDLWFDPAAVDVAVGEPVNLTMVNRGRIFHDLVIDDLGFRLDVDAGETATGGLQADRAGEYEYYCSVPGHAAGGMRGTLSAFPASS